MSMGKELVIREYNNKKKERKASILFVHGAWHGEWCWEKYFINIFTEKGYDCYSFNFSLHESEGEKPGINKLRIKDYIKDLSNVLEQFDEEPIVIAHSMGGFVVQKYLEKTKLDKVILLAPVPASGVFKVTLKLIFTRSYGLFNILKFNLFGLVNTKSKVKWTLFSDKVSEEILDYSTKRMTSESILVFIQMMLPLIKSRFHLQSSMLLLAGGNDNLFKVKEIKRTAKKYEAEFKEIEGVAHNMMLDVKHGVVAEEIFNWLNNKS